MNQNISCGKLVKELRVTLGLTQAELAARVGCATITIRKIEGDTLRPSVQIAERLAMALDIPLEERAEFVRLARSATLKTPSPPPTPTPPPLPEEIGREDLSGRAIRGYQLGERIGEGGFGAVYRAIQPVVEREVAVKIILPQYANQPEFIRRFESEAQLVARLEHPYIVPLYDYWREPDAAYLIMRLLRGGSLRERLKEGPLPLEAVLRMLDQIGVALHAAHRFGVIHRDLKPANILLDKDQNVYLADFGIAKNLTNPNLEDQTQAGALVGSPAYASPEQIRAESVMPQTDIYCLGVLLYEMLTGVQPFQGPTPIDYIMQHLIQLLPPLAEHNANLPAALEPVIRRATNKEPTERYPDIPSLLADVKEAVEGAAALDPIMAAWSAPDKGDTAAIENPFKGLRPFGEADADQFFGREALVQELLSRLGEEGERQRGAGHDLARFLAVVGASGSGKSSVVKAGLLPAVRRGGLPGSENWFVVDFMPGSHPFEELEAALLRVAVNPPESLLGQLKEDERGLLRAVRRVLPADADVELVLVIDQFEEVFTLVEDEETRTRFLNSLVVAVMDPRSRVRVVVTMRADFTDRPLGYVDFGELMRARTTFVLPLTPDELALTATGPAKQAGLLLEPGLTARIVREVGNQPGTLPLLQYALTELFERREGRRLTLAAYAETGGVLGALGRRAEEIFTGLDKVEQSAAQQLFLRLVTLGEGVEDTRRRVLRMELEALLTSTAAAPSPIAHIITAFGRYRLLAFDHDPVTRGPTVEVAHEALLREWPRLRSWLDESRADLRMQRILGRGAVQWQEAGQETSFLLRGARLSQFEIWAAGSVVALTQAERDYLNASLAAHQEQQAAEAARQARETALEQRSRKFLRALVGVFAAATFIAIILSGVAFNQRGLAQDNALLAGQNAATATVAQGQAIFEAATAVVAQEEAQYQAGQAATAAAEAQEEADRADAAAAEALEQQAVAEQEARAALEAYSLSLSVHAQQALDDLDSGTALALAIAASNMDDPPIEVLETLERAAFAPGARRQHLLTDADGEAVEIVSIAVSPDGDTALVGLRDGNIVLLDIETGKTLRAFSGQNSAVQGITFSPDGTMALSGGCNDVILWDIATGDEIRRFTGHSGCVYALDFSPDGQRVVTGCFAANSMWNPGELFLWDLESGEVIRRYEGHPYGVRSAVFSPDGRTVLSSSWVPGGDITEFGVPLILWDVESGEIIHRFPAPNDITNEVAISPDGRTALSTNFNTNVYLWDLQTGEQLRVFEGHGASVRFVAFSPDGHSAISSDMDGVLILWDVASGEPVARFAQTTRAPFAFLPDGRTALFGALDGNLALWDLFDANEIRRFRGHTGGVADVAFTPDGKHFLSAGHSDHRFGVPGVDRTLRLWNVETGELIWVFEGHSGGVYEAEISPDGRRALSASYDGTMRLWDLESGAEIRRFTYQNSTFWGVAFHPDGNQALTADDFGMLLWDLNTGEVLHHFIGHTGSVWAVAFSPDGRTALSGSADESMILWDVESGEQIRHFWGDQSVTNLVYTPEGRLAISGGGTGKVVVWDVETGEALRVFVEHHGFIDINMVDLGPDGRTVISTNLDGEVLVWDLLTGEVFHRFPSREPLPAYPALSPYGRFALIGSQDFTITLWRLETPSLDELHTWIEANRYVRELTCSERVQYQIEPLCEEVTEAPLVPPAPSTGEMEVPQRPQRMAQVGENQGEVLLGDFDVWLYEGQAGEILTIRLVADNPATGIPGSERVELGALDTFLFVIASDGSLLASNDDANVEEYTTDSSLEGLVLPVDGVYRIEARGWGEQTAGTYTLIIETEKP